MKVSFEVEQTATNSLQSSGKIFDDVLARIKELEGIMGSLPMKIPDKATLKTIIDEKGAVYTGQTNKDQNHGFGIMKYEDGSVYAGSWLHGRPKGKGWLLSIEGDAYKGDVSNGLASGHGSQLSSDGTKYEGEWQDS